ncbi:MAG: DM13 domain-containing protein [Candidatus Zixiibacteriota bacterium]
MGDQNYDIHSEVYVSNFRTWTIWSKRFAVNFGSAPSSP